MPPRLFVEAPLSPGAMVDLPPNASRHVQVLRLQPGDALTLFDGRGGQWQAVVAEMGRKAVSARVQAVEDHEAELPLAVTLACGMPANERMDTLVEKATELGAAAIAPLVTARSVLRVAGERADRKAQHWQAIAQAACEQCGRNRVPPVAAPQPLADWLARPLPAGHAGLVLSLDPAAPPLGRWLTGQAAPPAGLVLLSGPEGGLAPHELEAAQHAGYQPVSLGARVLRADTAPLAALAIIADRAA
jgi:16S rRNA (uracil1498-N3)-methyltransferase